MVLVADKMGTTIAQSYLLQERILWTIQKAFPDINMVMIIQAKAGKFLELAAHNCMSLLV